MALFRALVESSGRVWNWAFQCDNAKLDAEMVGVGTLDREGRERRASNSVS